MHVLLLVLALLIGVVGCEEDPASPGGDEGRVLSISAEMTEIVAGENTTHDVTLTITLTDSSGSPRASETVACTIVDAEPHMGNLTQNSDETGADGKVTAVYSVTLTEDALVTIQATSGGVSKSIDIALIISNWSDGAGGYYTLVDARSHDQYYYYDLANHEQVDIGDDQAKSNMQWHVAFSRVNGKLNGGAAGALGVRGVDLVDMSHPNGMDFDAVTGQPAVADTLWETDKINLVFDGWWTYTGPPSHQFLPSGLLFVVKTAAGEYAKVVVDSIRDPGRSNAGILTLKYFYQGDGSMNLDGTAQTAEVDVTAGAAYFSFEHGGVVQVADQMTSTEWDIKFEGFEAELNGGVSGPGEGAALPLEGETFEERTAVPAGSPFFQDSFASVFGSPTVAGSEWYDYNPEVHEIVSKEHVYLLDVPSTGVFKFAITNYYYVLDGEPVSAWLTVRYKRF